jgi:transcriptional regulator with XRE-family HTH domain
LSNDEAGSPSEAADDVYPVGLEIARLRRMAGLTGQQLGERVGWSQAKISRVETGATAADPADVRKLAHALNVSEEDLLVLVARAEDEHNQMTDWRVGKAGIASKQREYGRLEARGRMIRVFQQAVFPGLLQTSEYARAIMAASQRMLALGAGVEEPTSVYEAVAARLRRQEILDASDRQFSFVMVESVLSNRLALPEDMLAQVQRVRTVSRQANVTVGVIASDAALTEPPMNSFQLIDENVLTIDLFNTSIKTQGRSDIRLYRELFDYYERQAAPDLDAILDKYSEIYLDLSRPRHRRSLPLQARGLATSPDAP